MLSKDLRWLTILVSFTLALSGCAGVNGQQQTALDKSINECVGSVLIGAALGALVGSLSHGQAGKGALYGAGAGTVACAVMVAVNNRRDKERIRQNELQALQTGQPRTDSYIGDDGAQRIVRTSVQTVSMPSDLKSSPTAGSSDPIVGPCRKITTQISVVGKGQSEIDPGLTCRTAQGNYVNWNGQTAV